jgi:hypothetical protein
MMCHHAEGTKNALRPTRAKGAHADLRGTTLFSPLPHGSGLRGCDHTPAL